MAARRFDRLALGVLALGVGLRIGFGVFVEPGPLIRDADHYWRLGSALLERGELSFYPGVPSGFRTPGYPVFLAGVMAVFGPSERAVVVIQGLLAAVSLWLNVCSLRLLGVAGLALVLGVATLSFYPSYVDVIPTIMSENLSLPLMSLVIYCWARHSRDRRSLDAMLTGLAVGVSTLVRPASLLLVPALALADFLSCRDRFSWRRWVAATMLSITVLLPWMARNAAVGKGFVLEDFSSFQAYLCMVSMEPDFDHQHMPCGDWSEARRVGSAELSKMVGRPVTIPATYPIDTGTLSAGEINDLLRAHMIEIIRTRPREFLATLWPRFLILWGDIGNEPTPGRWYLHSAAMLFTFTVVVAGMFWRRTRREPLAALAFMLAAYTTATHLPMAPHNRYLWPALLVMLPAMAAHLVTAVDARGRRVV